MYLIQVTQCTFYTARTSHNVQCTLCIKYEQVCAMCMLVDTSMNQFVEACGCYFHKLLQTTNAQRCIISMYLYNWEALSFTNHLGLRRSLWSLSKVGGYYVLICTAAVNPPGQTWIIGEIRNSFLKFVCKIYKICPIIQICKVYLQCKFCTAPVSPPGRPW